MKVIKITKNIIQLHFQTQEELCKTFCRFQEHYESPSDRFRNKIFTLGEYRAWYTDMFGAWSYYSDWNGFNIPSWVLTPFKAGLFDPLLSEEQKLVDLFRDKSGRFYVIGTHEGHKSAIGHEICHALWYLDDVYQLAAETIVNTMENESVIQEIKSWLLGQGYCENMLEDEIHAYIAHYPQHVIKKFGELPKGSDKLLKLKEKYFEKYNIEDVPEGD